MSKNKQFNNRFKEEGFRNPGKTFEESRIRVKYKAKRIQELYGGKNDNGNK